jgi:hypothetical protein
VSPEVLDGWSDRRSTAGGTLTVSEKQRFVSSTMGRLSRSPGRRRSTTTNCQPTTLAPPPEQNKFDQWLGRS